MPIKTSIPLIHHSQEEFGKVAYEVMHHAFQVHADLGRIFYESVFRSTLRQILGSRCIEEFEILLTHQDFRKELYVDLILDLGCPFELKVVDSISDAHRSQLIQYLMLTGLSHGKLINFGAESVEHCFVNCHDRPEQRRRFRVDYVDWDSTGPMKRLEQIVVPLVEDWGTGLSRSLYQEAVIALVGRDEQYAQTTETLWKGQRTGRQPVNLIEDAVAIEITCIKNEIEQYESQLRRFLKNTTLESINWCNITSGCVRLQGMTSR